MKKLQVPFAGLLILLSIFSCRKEDLQTKDQQNLSETNPPAATIAPKQEGISESEWQSNLSWTSVDLPTHSVFYTNIKTNIPAETAEQGLVRVFKTSGNGTPQSLPFEETVNGQKYYWYYQVTKDNVMISVDVYGSHQNPTGGSSFKSVVLSKNAVANLEAKGNSRSKLMSMPMEAITSNP